MRLLSGGLFLVLLGCSSCGGEEPAAPVESRPAPATTSRPAAPPAERGAALPATEEGWRARLTPEEFRVLREKDTEPRWSGKFVEHKAEGTYTCAGCGQALFPSATKFESGTGWPSFYAPSGPGAVETEVDLSYGRRIEVHCSRCKGHLGHVFDDGPAPTGKRYCINSVSLGFAPKD